MKAILVFDMPLNCIECPCYSICGDDRIKYCSAILKEVDLHTIPNWCPLKPMQRKVVNMSKEKDNQYYYDLGFNDCVDEILGEE